MKALTPKFVTAFIEGAVEKAAVDASDVLWAKCDPMLDDSGELLHDQFTVTLRDNLDGPGEVRSFRVVIEEVPRD